jgi:hypothetical protein
MVYETTVGKPGVQKTLLICLINVLFVYVLLIKDFGNQDFIIQCSFTSIEKQL